MKADLGRGGTDAPTPLPLRVLIVEDSRDDALLLLRELRRGGYEPIHELVDTPEAMRRALEERGPWDVVLSDWQMPCFSGTRALEMSREANSETPFVIVSEKVGEEEAVEALRAGAHDYVIRGNLTRLCAAVERGLEEAQARRERERVEKSLKESEERFRSLVMNSSDMITVFAPDGTRLYASPSIERLLGYKPEDKLGGSAFDLVHPDDAPRVREEFAERARRPGTGRPFEFRVRHADGSWHVFEAIGTNLLNDPSVGGLVFNARDVTDRKRAEDALKESEERYRRLVELSPDAIIVHDGEEVLFLNTAGAELFGVTSPEELIGKPVMNFIHPDYRETVRERIAQTQERGERTDLIQEKFLRLDRRTVDVEAVSMPITYRGEAAALVVARDITGRKRAEDALKESEERFRATFDQAAVGVAHVDLDGSWLRVNQKLCEIGGYTREELLERTFQDITHPEDLEADLEHRGRLLAGKIPGYSMEKRYFRKDGSVVWINLTVSLVRAASGEPKYFIAIVEDITERKRAREALVQSEERYRAVVEQAAEGIVLFEVATGDILESNVALQELLGYATDELLNMKIYDLIAHDRESIDRNIRRVLEEGSRFMGERRYRCKDGSLVDVEVTASLICYGGKEAICAVIRDVTERVEAFRLLKERVTALARISASLTVGQTMEGTLDALAARVVQSTAAVACSVVLIDAETGLSRTAGSHGLPEGYTGGLQEAYRGGARLPTREVFHTRQPMLVRDVRQSTLNHTPASPLHRFLREVPWDTIYFVPLISRDQALGTINLYYLPEQEPGEDETVFLGAVADQTAVVVENAILFAAAQDKAALEERQRLARELHDSVSQALYGIILGTDAARTLLDRDPGRVTEPLEYVLSLAKAGLAEMRALIFELRPESLATEGLIAALEKQTASVQSRHELAVHVTLCDEPDAPLEVKEALYRVAQEALNNTVKHAEAEGVELRLEQDTGEILLEVRDDGRGFDPEGSFPGHFGLKSMRERVAHLGGTLQIKSAPEEGTRISVRIPPGT